jgi:hypothetical protein
MSDDVTTLAEAIKTRGPYAVWDLMDDDGQRSAAEAAWNHGSHETRALLELALAKAMKFRPQSVHRLPAERVVPRLVKLADELPEPALFQLLYHLHMDERRPLLVSFLDTVGLPHEEGVLDLPDDAEPPTAEALAKPVEDLIAAHGRKGLVYLATLRVADAVYWEGLESVLEGYGEDGEKLA